MMINKMTRAQLVHEQATRAVVLAQITREDERRIYRHALRSYQNGVSVGGVIARAYSDAARCARITQ